eukprot:GEZU01008884.1.p2 GENE.GEZU01008884.1~~GEZU01008884.1.p2  ORF type:complete len:200 (+),score=76.60 GEZU01008884.1:426-1025(+)
MRTHYKISIEKEKAEIERRRNMTDEEREREDREYAKLHPREEKKKWGFLQRYYHKGAFYQEVDREGNVKEELYRRDYSAPTLEDKFDKAILPKVMQVKNFGRSGRTKYTHLLDQDTSIPDYIKQSISQRKREEQQQGGGGSDASSSGSTATPPGPAGGYRPHYEDYNPWAYKDKDPITKKLGGYGSDLSKPTARKKQRQ